MSEPIAARQRDVIEAWARKMADLCEGPTAGHGIYVDWLSSFVAAIDKVRLNRGAYDFTTEDVDALTRTCDNAERWLANRGWAEGHPDDDRALKASRTIRNRIAQVLRMFVA